MKKILLVSVVALCAISVCADDNLCYGQDKDGNFYEGRLKTTERIITTNSSTSESGTNSTSQQGTTSGGLSTKNLGIDANMTKTNSSSNEQNHQTSDSYTDKKICVPNSYLQKTNTRK